MAIVIRDVGPNSIIRTNIVISNNIFLSGSLQNRDGQLLLCRSFIDRRHGVVGAILARARLSGETRCFGFFFFCAFLFRWIKKKKKKNKPDERHLLRETPEPETVGTVAAGAAASGGRRATGTSGIPRAGGTASVITKIANTRRAPSVILYTVGFPAE